MGLSFRMRRRLILCMFDIICYIFVTIACFLCTFIEPLQVANRGQFFSNALVLGVLIFTFRAVFGFYKNVWRYTYTRAYLGAVLQDACATVVTILLAFFVRRFTLGYFELRIWQFVIISSLFCLMTLGSRYIYRLYYKYRIKDNSKNL